MLQVVYDIDKKADQILAMLTGSSGITDRLDKIEHSLYSGAGTDLIIGSAAIATKLESTNFVSGSAGWQINKSGSVEFQDGTFRGTIYATAGEFLDVVYVGAAADRIIIDGVNKNIRSEGYVAGQSGFQVDSAGDAEFNNVYVRGSIVTSVFSINEISATAGTQMIAHHAGVLRADATATASTFTITIEGTAGGTAVDIGDVADVVRLKDATNSTWATIASKTNEGTYYSYVLTYQSGSNSATYYAGLAVVNYGASGEGYIIQTAEGTGSPRMSVYTHAGAPWTTVVERSRIGNLNSWGGFATDVYGIALGDYAGNNYLSYDDGTGVVKLVCGSGAVSLDGDGITIVAGTSTPNIIEFKDGADVVFDISAYISASVTSIDMVTTVKNAADGGYLSISAERSGSTGAEVICHAGTAADQDYILLDALDKITFSLSGYEGATFTLNGTVPELTLKYGAAINEFSTDGTLAGNSDSAVPTEQAVKAYVDNLTAGPSFKARLSANQTIVTATWTTVQFNTEEWDTDSDYATGSYRFTPGRAGKYHVDTLVRWSGCGAGDDVRIQIQKNGSSIGGAYDLRRADGNFQSQNAHVMVDMNGTTDYIQVQVYQASGANRQIDTTTNTYFSAYWVRS